MSKLIFNRRLMHTIVLLAHVITVWLFATFIFSLDEITMFRISTLPPVQSSFDSYGVSLIGYSRDVFHVIAAVCGLIIGSKLSFFGVSRKSDVARFFIVTLGVQILFGAGLNLVLIGSLAFGGFWHLFCVFFIGLEAISFVVMSLILLLNWRTFQVLADQQQTAVPDLLDADEP